MTHCNFHGHFQGKQSESHIPGQIVSQNCAGITYLSPSLQLGHVHATRRILALGVPSAPDSLLTADDTVP
jgi:hypothetical protein